MKMRLFILTFYTNTSNFFNPLNALNARRKCFHFDLVRRRSLHARSAGSGRLIAVRTIPAYKL